MPLSGSSLPHMPFGLPDLRQFLAQLALSCSGRARPDATPSAFSKCKKPSRCNVINLKLRLAGLAIGTSLLTGCATARSDGGGCPPVPAYSRVFLARAADELRGLPPGAAIEQMLADYQVMRDQARACERLR